MSSNPLKIIKTDVANFDSLIDLKRALQDSGHPWLNSYPVENESPKNYIRRIINCETIPPHPFVPETIYWGLVGDTIVGRTGVRHHLNEKLEKFGGHIGYEIHPAHRDKGYATEMLRQVLQTDLVRRIGKVLLTCAPDNVASNKTILSNGGVCTQKIYVDFIEEDRNHYWIDVTQSS